MGEQQGDRTLAESLHAVIISAALYKLLHACSLLIFFLSCIQIRKDVEGSLFLTKRNAEPFFQIIILNKKSQGMHLSVVNQSSDTHARRECGIEV